MKNAIYLLLVMIITVSLFSCKKSNSSAFGTSVSGTENVLSLAIYDPEEFSFHGIRARGYEFKSDKDGRITHFGARLSKGTYPVVLWDSSAQSVIKAVNVTVSDSTKFNYVDIDDISIVANKVYVITVLNTDVDNAGVETEPLFFNITAPADYLPKTVGDITYIASVEKSNPPNSSTLFPYSFAPEKDIIMGCPSFKFEPRQ